jgi:hypothetical protein
MLINANISTNPVYKPLIADQSRYMIMMGGSGSGKSVFAAQKIILRCFGESGHRILIIRKVATTLRGSVFQLFNDLLSEYDLKQVCEVNKTERRITFPNGSEIVMAGLDDPEKIKSIAGISSVWVEEATELTESDFNQLELRVRGETVGYKQFIITFNPIDVNHWLKKRFFDQSDPNVTTLKTTYKDNKYLDPDYIHQLEVTIRNRENLYRIYTLGEWGLAQSGAEYFKNFTRSAHVYPVEYDPDLPIHLSFDFNAHPGMHWIAAQITGSEIRVIDEQRSVSPRNNTKGSCYDFKAKYRNHNAGLFIYGDPSGKSEGTRSESGHNDFRIIEMELAEYRPQMRVLRKAPGLAINGQWINEVFGSENAGISVKVNDRCRILIDDFLYLKESADGGILKERTKDAETGISYERFGHCSDAFRYLITYAFNTEFERFQKGDVEKYSFTGARSGVKF